MGLVGGINGWMIRRAGGYYIYLLGVTSSFSLFPAGRNRLCLLHSLPDIRNLQPCGILLHIETVNRKERQDL
jgi:hypothetical protein